MNTIPENRKTKRLIPAMVIKDFNSNELLIHSIEKPIYVQFHQFSDEINLNEIEIPSKDLTPKRYETTIYFKPLAVPTRYSSSIFIKINSTKRTYNESVNYQKKLCPRRFVETMKIDNLNSPKPIMYVSEIKIEIHKEDNQIINLESEKMNI